jgi:hypothetical protein
VDEAAQAVAALRIYAAATRALKSIAIEGPSR